MKRFMQRVVMTFGVGALIFTGASVVAVNQATPVSAKCKDTLLTFPAWYKGLQRTSCELKSPGKEVELDKYVLRIALNVIDMLLQAVAYVAIIFVLYGGFQFMTLSQSPDGVRAARKTIQNAVIGLVIAVAAVAIVKFIAGAIV